MACCHCHLFLLYVDMWVWPTGFKLSNVLPNKYILICNIKMTPPPHCMRNWFIFGLVSAGEIKVSIFWELPQNVLMLFSLLTIAHHGGMIRGKSESFFISKTKKRNGKWKLRVFYTGWPIIDETSETAQQNISDQPFALPIVAIAVNYILWRPYQVSVLDLSEVSSFVGNFVLSTLLILWIYVHDKERDIKGF